ncbi:hypothetical protein V6N13_124539 [Hibiscus sabdariffa]
MWKSPLDAWCCLNTDASVDASDGFATEGGVVRTSNCSWLIGFYRSIGITSPLQAELWGIYIELQIALNHVLSSYKFSQIILKLSSYSMIPISLVKGTWLQM